MTLLFSEKIAPFQVVRTAGVSDRADFVIEARFLMIGAVFIGSKNRYLTALTGEVKDAEAHTGEEGFHVTTFKYIQQSSVSCRSYRK